MTVKQLEDTMLKREYAEWKEYAAKEPLISDRLELMLGKVISSLSGLPPYEVMVTTTEYDKEVFKNTAIVSKINEFFEGSKDG